MKKEEKGSLDLRFFALQEVEEEMEIDDEEEGEERQAFKVANQFFKIEKGKQFALYSGKHIFYLASPEKRVADEWIATCRRRWPSSTRSRPSSRRSSSASRDGRHLHDDADGREPRRAT